MGPPPAITALRPSPKEWGAGGQKIRLIIILSFYSHSFFLPSFPSFSLSLFRTLFMAGGIL